MKRIQTIINHKCFLALLIITGFFTFWLNLAHSEANFQFKQIVNAGKQSTDIAVGDINNDGHLDIAVSNMFDHSITIMINDGAGNFEQIIEEPLGEGPDGNQWLHAVTVAIGDLDGDGLNDLAVGNFQILESVATPFSQGGVVLLFNQGDLTFEKVRRDFVKDGLLDGIPSSVQIRDFTGDGQNDIILGSNGVQEFTAEGIGIFNGGLVPYVNQGNREFTPAEQIFDDFNIGNIVRFVFADADGDGNDDLIGIDQGVLRLVFNNQGQQIVTTEAPQFVFFEAVNNSFEFVGFKTQTLQFVPWSLDTADFNRDGRQDIALALVGEQPSATEFLAENASIEIFFNQNQQFMQQIELSVPVENAVAFSVHAEDFDGDGDVDLALTAQDFINRPEGTELVPFLRIYDNNGDNTFTLVQELDVSPNPRSMVTGDFDSDGDLDLAVNATIVDTARADEAVDGEVWIFTNQQATAVADWTVYK